MNARLVMTTLGILLVIAPEVVGQKPVVRYVRYAHQEATAYGILDGETIRELRGDLFADPVPTGRRFPLAEVKLLAPCEPSKIVAVGVNYPDHAAEFKKELPKEPLLFLKPSTAVLDPFEAIRLPARSHRVDYEAELAVVIKKRAAGIAEAEAADFILGYTCFNDVTARDLQKLDGQWTRAKGFDTFAPLGPSIVTDIDPGDLKVESYLNGERRQSASTRSTSAAACRGCRPRELPHRYSAGLPSGPCGKENSSRYAASGSAASWARAQSRAVSKLMRIVPGTGPGGWARRRT